MGNLFNKSCLHVQRKCDIFGERINFKFKKESKITSPIGTFFSCITMTLFLIFFINRSEKIISGSDPYVSMLVTGTESSKIDLQQMNFFFAIQKIDPTIGYVEVKQVTWKNNSGRVKTKESIGLTNCEDYMLGGKL